MEVVVLMIFAIIFFIIIGLSVILALLGIFDITAYILTVICFIRLIYIIISMFIDYKDYKKTKAKIIEIKPSTSKSPYPNPIIAYISQSNFHKKECDRSVKFGKINSFITIFYNKKDPNDVILDPYAYIFDDLYVIGFFFIILLITSTLCLIF